MLNSDDAAALLVLAERNIRAAAAIQPSTPAAPLPAQAIAEQRADAQAQDRLRLFADLATALDTETSTTLPGGAASSAAEQAAASREQSRQWAVSALVGDPLNSRALSLLGQQAQMAGDDAAAAKFLDAAGRRSIRQSLAVYWLMQQSYQKRDYVGAVHYADALLRTRSQAAAQVIPILVQLSEIPTVSETIKTSLVAKPNWRQAFLVALASKGTDPRMAIELLLALRQTPAPPTSVELKTCVEALIARKQYELAYYAWLQFLPPEQLSNTGFLFNGSFEMKPSGLPFDWLLHSGDGAVLEIVARPEQPEQHSLLVELGYGRIEFRGAQQLIMLAPGTYTFRGDYQGELVGQRGLIWRGACVEAQGSPLGTSPMVIGVAHRWKSVEFTFTVPHAGCRTQLLHLALDARMSSEQLVSGSLWFDELRLTRAN
jgi:hypothetical protein